MATTLDQKVPKLLWKPTNPEKSQMYQFAREVERKRGIKLSTFSALHEWSVSDIPAFWEDCWHSANLIHSGSYKQVIDLTRRMDSNPPWFEGVKINYAENILFTRSRTRGEPSTLHKEDSKIAITSAREGGTEVQDVTWGELRSNVGRFSNALRAAGVKKGNRVAAVASNSLTTVVVMLATITVGAVFTSSATDMGVKGVLERLLQVEPVWVFMDEGAVWNGKKVDLRGNIRDVERALREKKDFKGVVVVPRWKGQEEGGLEGVEKVTTLKDFVGMAKDDVLAFERVEFNDPMAIMYSSGTTGAPKCIVHRAGGVLLNAYKDNAFHFDSRPDTVLLQFTTTGWIMFYMCIQTLLCGSRTILYDGSPFIPTPLAFLKFISNQKVTNLGISPRYLQELLNNNISPRSLFDFGNLRCVVSTGMILSETLFDWFYSDKGFGQNVQLANITGGTDIACAFASGNPLEPVYRGGFQGLALGYKVEVYDSGIGEDGGPTVKGKPVENSSEPGELVCTKPFPTMPLTFFGPNGAKKYHEAYFARFDDVWTHGDFISHPYPPPYNHIVHCHGRSDGVLNPSGIRFGSSEIYSLLIESPPLSNHILDALLIGQRRASKNDPDEQLLLFITLKPSPTSTTTPPNTLPQPLIDAITATISKNLSKRHLPKYIFPTPPPRTDLGKGLVGVATGWIPYTINGKKVERPVKKVVCEGGLGKQGVSATVVNGWCLKWYEQFFDVEGVVERGGPWMSTEESERKVKARL